MLLLDALATFLIDEADARPGDGIVVAFSGGADSTALLFGLARLAPELGLRVIAAHLDHALDPGSAERAAAAKAAAACLGIACRAERRPISVARSGGAGLEAEARRVRYGFLEQVRRAHGCQWIATAHHRDDQAETVLLRARFGSGPLGLAGIQPVRGPILRPLLGLGRDDLSAALAEAGLTWTEDPTNDDVTRPRNRLRRLLALTAAAPGAPPVADRLAAVALRARGARGAVDRALYRTLDARREFDGASVELSAMRRLPATLVSPALAMLHRRAGIAYPSSRRAAGELERQLDREGASACDCGRGFRWEVRGVRLHLARTERKEPAPVLFTYTLELPGEVEVKELSLRFRVFALPVTPWMFEASPRRAALALPPEHGHRVTVRNRRPGDLIRPLGWEKTCRVKDLLINRKVPRRDRSRLPLLVSGEDVIWIPGVAIDDRYRIGAERQAWVAEIRVT
ncbi:MAG TPA: tRNA lysidine(34) synthetase TilS [Thermoanaerobaculia bacterium]|nr:tRNA lysidine(34) synthetase TilS [Thermoanaerobaculia bacterium]